MKLGSALVFFSLLSPLSSAPAVAAPVKYPETARVMQMALAGELLAHARYLAYAQRAREERLPSLALFATALGASEAIHERNFKKVLSDLGVAADLSIPGFAVADTRTNLKIASAAEMDEIDRRYPQLLERMRSEGYSPGIDALDHAWRAEKQHRDMIALLIAGTGVLFPAVVKTFEDSGFRYFVCQNCGSTLDYTKLPKETCPICSAPVAQYREIVAGG